MFKTLLRRSDSLPLFCSFVFSACQGLFIPSYPLLALHYGLSMSLLIASFSFGSFLFIFGGPYWAKQSLVRGHYFVLLVGVCGLFLSFMILGSLYFIKPFSSIVAFLILLLSRTIYGLTASAIVPISQSLLAQTADAKAKPMASYSLGLNLGRLCGFVSVLLLRENLGVLFLLYGLSLLIPCFVVFKKANGNSERLANVVIPPTMGDLDWRLLKTPLLVAFLFTVFIELLNSSLAFQLKDVFLLSGAQSASLAAKLFILASGVVVFVQFCLARYVRRSNKDLLVLGAVFMALGASLLIQLQGYWQLHVSMVLMAIGIGLVSPLNLAKIYESTLTSHHSEKAGWVSFVNTLGFTTGGVLAAIAFSVNSRGPLYLLVLSAVSIVYLSVYTKRGVGS